MVTPLPASPSYLQRPIIPVEDPGKGPGPLFLDQTGAEGWEKTFGDRPPPPPFPPSISRSGSGIVYNSNFSLICENVDSYFVFFCQCTC